MSTPTQPDIAIVGMAVNLPGAPNTAKLWEVLEQGINTVIEIPEFRFKVSEYLPPHNINPKRVMKAHTGNFIENVDEFDNQFFRISPREARSMDPQQRILLHTAYEALEDAGYVPDSTPSFQKEDFGCYIGNGGQDYIQNLRNEVDAYYLMGTLRAFLSGRTSYVMQMGGPSITVDTGCSSSMIAIYQAARALMTHDCGAVIAGGVNIFTSPDRFLGLDRAHFLSPTGQSKPYDSSADGYSRGEGCGIFILKRLEDAIRENDNIHGVMRACEVNHSGTSHSITHPHAPTQAKLWKRLLDKSGIPAERINVVEGHGTGTQAGDPTEMSSIRSVLGSAGGRREQNPLYITSVKANIGHQESASASAGLAKILLMLKHKSIPRHISFKTLNPRIAPLELDHIKIPTVQQTWEPAKSYANQPRVALLSNFGAAGSNSGAIIEEYVPPARFTKDLDANLDLIFGLSAKTEKALGDLKDKFIGWLGSEESKGLRLGDIAYTTTARRIIYSHRLSVVASSREDLVKKLQTATPSFVQQVQPANEHAHEEEEEEKAGETETDKEKVVFVFSGQGVQYIGMGKALYESSKLFKEAVDECHAILAKNGFPGVFQILLSEGDVSGLSTLEEFEAYQAAIFALEYGLAKLWISWGVEPSAVIGHSLGEYAALVIANVLSLEDALLIVASRVRLMVQKCQTDATGMMAVALSAAQVTDLLRESSSFDDITVSCINSPTDSVVSGSKASLKALKEYIDKNKPGCKNTMLTVPFGYHSKAMNPLLADLTKVAAKATIKAPTLPIISNLYGKVVMPGDSSVFNAEYFARHCAEPVQFETGIRAFLSTKAFGKVDTWIEIGPHASLLPMLKWNPLVKEAGNGLLLPSIRKQQSPWMTLTASLAQLYTSSNVATTVNWRAVFGQQTDDSVACVSLPTYPFARNKFWVAFKEETGAILEDEYMEVDQVDAEENHGMNGHANGSAKNDGFDKLAMPDQVLKLVSETSAVSASDIKQNTELETLGFDSMMSIELMEKLNLVYVGANFDHHALQACHSVADITKQVSVRMGLAN